MMVSLVDPYRDSVLIRLSHQVTNAIIHHCSLSPAPTPISLPIPIPFIGRSLSLQLPFFKLPPNDTVFLPSFPYRPGYWLLDTPLRGITERMARRKYGLE
jgi:hypothetical protein